jgi:hypothetical protein
MAEELDVEAALAAPNRAFAEMTADEQARARREQHISFAWGNLALTREGPRVSREELGRLYDQMQAER